MTEMKIDLEGRILIREDVKEQTADQIISTSVYDDGTEITFVQKADVISVSSNKELEVQSDGFTIKIK